MTLNRYLDQCDANQKEFDIAFKSAIEDVQEFIDNAYDQFDKAYNIYSATVIHDGWDINEFKMHFLSELADLIGIEIQKKVKK